MASSARQHSKAETAVSIVVLLTLAGIAGGVIAKRISYRRPENVSALNTPSPAGGETSAPFAAFLPEALRPLTEPEQFTPASLSEKINGKAELYLPAGFVGLSCQRFASVQNADEWIEVFVYDMGRMSSAFTVYSAQFRQNAEKIPLGRFAYRTANALYFVHGRFYVELVAAAVSKELDAAMLAFGENFVSQTPAESEALEELALFPTQGLLPDSLSLATEEEFGIEGFENVYKAVYDVDGRQVTAFLSRRRSAAEAEELAKRYQEFYLGFGGRQMAPPAEIPQARAVMLFDIHKIAFALGPFLAGVHEADSAEAAETVAARLNARLAEAAP